MRNIPNLQLTFYRMYSPSPPPQKKETLAIPGFRRLQVLYDFNRTLVRVLSKHLEAGIYWGMD